jgi:hypothetical protein
MLEGYSGDGHRRDQDYGRKTVPHLDTRPTCNRRDEARHAEPDGHQSLQRGLLRCSKSDRRDARCGPHRLGRRIDLRYRERHGDGII